MLLIPVQDDREDRISWFRIWYRYCLIPITAGKLVKILTRVNITIHLVCDVGTGTNACCCCTDLQKKKQWNSPCLNFFHLLARKSNIDKFSIYSNKFFHDLHLSDSSFTCPGLRTSGLARRLVYVKAKGIWFH
jgi:hypothetical protein